MTESDLLNLINTTLASTARTVRAALLILTIALATGVAPLSLPTIEPASPSPPASSTVEKPRPGAG